jgi:hypothetical protein
VHKSQRYLCFEDKDTYDLTSYPIAPSVVIGLFFNHESTRRGD